MEFSGEGSSVTGSQRRQVTSTGGRVENGLTCLRPLRDGLEATWKDGVLIGRYDRSARLLPFPGSTGSFGADRGRCAVGGAIAVKSRSRSAWLHRRQSEARSLGRDPARGWGHRDAHGKFHSAISRAHGPPAGNHSGQGWRTGTETEQHGPVHRVSSGRRALRAWHEGPPIRRITRASRVPFSLQFPGFECKDRSQHRPALP